MDNKRPQIAATVLGNASNAAMRLKAAIRAEIPDRLKSFIADCLFFFRMLAYATKYPFERGGKPQSSYAEAVETYEPCL